ncbi:MAG: alpha/beta fold hydrolase [Phycisphaerae bacterium]|nr:alpha/beta fold hydrolase [Phycisphaerae bacterium]
MITKHWRCWLGAIVLAALSSQIALGGDRCQIQRAESLPESTPWDLDALSHAPVHEWADGTEVRSLYYTGEPYKGKPTRVFAYYATPGSLAGDPTLDKNLPAIVLVHGGGGQAFSPWVTLWAARGYAAIAMDLAGCGPGKTRLDNGGPDQSDQTKFGAIDQPVTDQWTYHAVANVIKAHSLILAFPEVDPERTALTGISWGGYLTCIAAGLDSRFAAAVPVYGCGFLHVNSCWLAQFAEMSPQNKAKWVQLWDPSRYVGSAVMPMLFVNGGTDFAYPPDSFARTYSLVQSPRTIRFSPTLSHGHIFDRPKAIEVFMDHHLRQGLPLARIPSATLTKTQVTAPVITETRLVRAHLYYTLDTLPGDPKQRTWVEKPATLLENQVIADPPPEHTVICFVTVTDDRDTTISSELMFPGGMNP